MKIVPAVLTDRKDILAGLLKAAEGFAEQVQIDIMDGRFVPSRSVSKQDLQGVSVSSWAEAHLMVEDPLSWLDSFQALGAKRIIFHFEIRQDKREVVAEIRKRNLEVGLAVNPPTQIEEFKELVESVDTVLFMAVHPGFYGAQFVPEVVDKIKEFKRRYPAKPAGIDGGVKLDNAKEISRFGLDFICVGSAIFNTPDPAQSYRDFVRITSA
jgi:ribulose-phosphate 3-epimerase